MRTILDQGHTWFLESVIKEDELIFVLVEGSKGAQEDLYVGEANIGSAHIIEVNPTKKVIITFQRTVAWQVVDESFTAFDKEEICDDNSYLKVLERSKYLDYVNANHGWYIHMRGAAKHYRIWTENDVIDVIAYAEPSIQDAEDYVKQESNHKGLPKIYHRHTADT